MARTVEQITKVPEVRKGDTVVVLQGKDAGKRGVVDRVIHGRRPSNRGYAAGRNKAAVPATTASVVVEGINVSKRHTKPRPRASQTDRVPQMQQGGIMDIAQPLPLGKVMVVCPRCDRPTRIGHVTLENGRRVRVCHHCGEPLEGRES